MNLDPVDPLRSDRRRDWGLLFLAGGGMAMTAFATWSLWLVRETPSFAFWLGMTAMGMVGIVLTGFAGLIVKRTLRLSRDGLEVADIVQEEKKS